MLLNYVSLTIRLRPHGDANIVRLPVLAGTTKCRRPIRQPDAALHLTPRLSYTAPACHPCRHGPYPLPYPRASDPATPAAVPSRAGACARRRVDGRAPVPLSCCALLVRFGRRGGQGGGDDPDERLSLACPRGRDRLCPRLGHGADSSRQRPLRGAEDRMAEGYSPRTRPAHRSRANPARPLPRAHDRHPS